MKTGVKRMRIGEDFFRGGSEGPIPQRQIIATCSRYELSTNFSMHIGLLYPVLMAVGHSDGLANANDLCIFLKTLTTSFDECIIISIECVDSFEVVAKGFACTIFRSNAGSRHRFDCVTLGYNAGVWDEDLVVAKSCVFHRHLPRYTSPVSCSLGT
jgi:hypothetical protein